MVYNLFAIFALVASASASALDLSFARSESYGQVLYDTAAAAEAFTPSSNFFVRATGCTPGFWTCDGNNLSVCNNGANVPIEDCTAVGLKCIAADGHYGCIVDSQVPNSIASAIASSKAAEASTPSAANSPTDNNPQATTTSPPTSSTPPPAWVTPSPEDGGDGEDCWEYEWVDAED